MIGNNLLKFHKTMVSDTMNKKLTVEYDEQFDNCQEEEDDWVSSIIGSEDDAVYDVLANL